MHKISFATPDELQVEIDLGKNADGQPQYRRDDAGSIMLIYSECTRGVPAPSLQESYEKFRVKISQDWGVEVSSVMANLIVEACVKITNDLKKKHIVDTNLKSSESIPPISPTPK